MPTTHLPKQVDAYLACNFHGCQAFSLAFVYTFCTHGFHPQLSLLRCFGKVFQLCPSETQTGRLCKICPVRHAAWQLTAALKLCLVCTVLMLKVSQWVKAIAICRRCSSSLTVSAFLRWQSTDLLFWSIAVLFAITIPVFHKFCISLSCTAFGRENLSSTFFLTFCENTSANVTLKYSTGRAWFFGYLSSVFLSVAVANSTASFLQILFIACRPLTSCYMVRAVLCWCRHKYLTLLLQHFCELLCLWEFSYVQCSHREWVTIPSVVCLCKLGVLVWRKLSLFRHL